MTPPVPVRRGTLEARTQRGASVRDFARIIGDAADAWIDDDVPRLSASVAFYTVLSIVPFLIITTVAAHIFGEKAAETQSQLMWDIQNVIGTAGARAIQALLGSARNSSTTATVVGFVTLAFGASAVVMELRDSLNTIWHVPIAAATSGMGTFVRLVRERFYLFGLILGAGILLVGSLALSAVATIPGVRHSLNVPSAVVHVAVFLGSFVVITILFAAIYKLVPDVKLNWTDVIVGASFTSFLFTLGKQLIGIYLGHVSYSSSYGAAGSLLILLVWVYYSAQLFFFGAEFTKAYAKNARVSAGNSGSEEH